ncbi:MAG: hypothetical protein ABI810_15120 [Sphingomonas bacterium]
MRGVLHHLLQGLSIRAFGLAALGLAFMIESIGSAMLIVGPFLFDKVEVSLRCSRIAAHFDDR